MMRRTLLGLLALFLAAAAVPTATARDLPGALGEVHASQLPPEASETLARIRSGGPFPYAKDGAVFANRERALPSRRRGYYREYTVKTPGVRNRGARRIIWGAGGEYYYTEDHYRRFRRILE